MCLYAAMRQKYDSNWQHESNIGISLEANRSTLNNTFSNINALQCFLLWEIFFGKKMLHTLSTLGKEFHFKVGSTHWITINSLQPKKNLQATVVISDKMNGYRLTWESWMYILFLGVFALDRSVFWVTKKCEREEKIILDLTKILRLYNNSLSRQD